MKKTKETEAEEITESTIEAFCKKHKLKNVDFGRICGISKQTVNKYLTTYKGPLVVRHNISTGIVKLVRVEKIMGSGTLNNE